MSHRWTFADAADVLRRDPRLRRVIDRVGEVELRSRRPYFWTLCVAIIAQQISAGAARAISGRVRDLFPDERVPRPASLLAAPPGALREAGVSPQKLRYLYALAQAFAEGELRDVRFSRLGEEEVVERLTAVKGIGVWTAEMFLIFCLRRPDVFPVGDLGIRRGMERFIGTAEPGAMVRRAERWRPYRTAASIYLWRAQDAQPA